MRRVVLLTTLFCLSNIFGEAYATNVLSPNTTTLADLGISSPKNYPLAVIPAAQVGLALAPVTPVTQILGMTLAAANIAYSAYYAQQAEKPLYAELSDTGNPDDALFCPAYNAVKANFVSPDSYPHSEEQYIGKEGALGARVQALSDYVRAHADDYPELHAVISPHVTTSPAIVNSDVVKYSVLDTPSGRKKITGNWSTFESGGYFSQRLSKISSNTGGSTPVFLFQASDGDPEYYLSGNYICMVFQIYQNGADILCYIAKAYCQDTTDAPTVTPTPGQDSVNYQTLKTPLKNSLDTATIVNQVRNAIRNLPENQKIASDMAKPTQVPAQQATPITNQDLQNFYTANTTNIYNKYQDTVTNNVTVQGDVTNEQAKAAAELAEKQAQEIDKETEPSINVPSSFYTPICDLSQKSLSECLNYQQVLDASSAFQSTALYQLPNLILDCLGYVEGDGCTYPPTITIDFQNHFTSEPIVIDMAPFESVVQVMKFFFAILCIVATGKAVMVLFGGGV